MDLLVIHEEVRSALADDRPVVALESTIVAHGLPWPENLEIAQALESEVRRHGATPATVAVVSGRLTVGLDAGTIERMARAAAPGSTEHWRKANATDLGPLFATGANAATTVSATTFAAARAGIRVFATGGIGGVHRGDDMDVSSDLTTLAHQPVAVISAGAKAILDLPRTLEVLETLGVLVLGVGTSEFPAFYVRSSGLALEHRVDGASHAARVLQAHWTLAPGRGVLLANPIPEADELEPKSIQTAIEAALSDAARLSIRGKQLTPHLLSFLARATEKRSLAANRALALHNAAFGAQVAVELTRLPPLR